MTKRRDPSATPEDTPVIGASYSVHADWRLRAEQALRTLGRADEHGRTTSTWRSSCTSWRSIR